MSIFQRNKSEGSQAQTGPGSGQEIPTSLEVVGLHPLRFEDSAVEKELDEMQLTDPEERSLWRDQYLSNYRNAWLVVLRFGGRPDQLDFDKLTHGAKADSPSNQAAWAPTIVESGDGGTRAAFYLHYVKPEQGLWYGRTRLPFPKATEAPAELFRQVPYMAPD